MRCPSCNHDNRPDRRYCAQCGSQLGETCLSCGTRNDLGERFCGSCGRALTGTAPEGERRQLTVLFCDLVGSTALAGQLDPEDWREVSGEYQRAAAETVTRFGGHVAKYLGDGLLVYFGYPHAHEDDPERAVRAGLALLDTVADLNHRLEPAHGVRLAVRVGMHTGPVVIGEGAGARAEVFGDTPNVAARVQALADPDAVLITEATHRLVPGRFIVEAKGAPPLKGVRQAVPVFRVVQASGVRSRLATAEPRGLTPFVGREAERRLLRERWAQARVGEGQVVLITGEPGIGKSRLVQTLREHLAGEPHTWIECAGSPYHQNTPFHAVVDTLQQGLAWRGDESAAERLQGLERVLEVAGLRLPEAVPPLAPLLSLPVPDHYPPLPASPDQQRRKLLATLTAWLFGAARVQPIVLVVEDLHWVDPSTLELQGLLVEQGATAPVLLLHTARLEFRAPWPLLAHHTQVTLGRLSHRHVREMVAHVAPYAMLAEPVIEAVVTRTDGIPLYVEELTKAVLEADGGGTTPARTIPATLQDSLMARLDRLGGAREVAQVGAVIGREFSYALLHAVSPLPEAELQAALVRLTDAELVYPRGIPPEATYVFKHALVQDTAYAALLRSQRRELHRAIARALFERFPAIAEEQPEVLGHHSAEAGEIEPAIVHYQRAGERATQRSANEEAIGHLRRALDLVGTLPETRERNQMELCLQMAIGAPLTAARGQSHPEYEQTYARARALASQIGESPELPRVLARLAVGYQTKGDLATAAEVAQEALAAGERTGDAFALLSAHYQVALPLIIRGHFSRALQHFEQSIHLYNPSAHGSLAYAIGSDYGVNARGYAAWCHMYLGHPDRALAGSEEAVALARRIEHPLSLAQALFFVGGVHLQRGELDRMRERAEEVIGLSERLGFPFVLGVGRGLRGFARAESGEGEAGIAEMRQAMGELARIGSGIGAPQILCLLAEGLRKVGRYDDALGALGLGVARAEQQGQHFYDAELHRLRAEILLDTDGNAVEEAEALFGQSLEIARRQEAKTFELRAATSLARLWQRQGKRDAVRTLLAPVYAWFTEGFDTRDLQAAKALLEELR